MRAADVAHFAYRATRGYRTRSLLTLAAMAIGVASVIVLTALGEGARRYVTGEFAALGTHLLIVLPGRSETAGGPPPLLGETPRDLTLDDALALLRSPHVARVAPISVGSAPASWREREREALVLGSTRDFQAVRKLSVAQGRFLPAADPRRALSVCVLGAKIKRELFGNHGALGEWVRLGDRRFRVVGVLASEGRSIGVDLEEVVVVPVAAAQALFDSPGLFRVLVEARTAASIEPARDAIRDVIRARHEGEDDVTVITQDAVIATFDRIFRALTYSVAGIAAISLCVAGVLIMNVMLVAVAQRTTEIGLLKALGTPRGDVVRLFMAEATMLSLAGAVIGLALGIGATRLVTRLYPVLPLAPPAWAIAAALLVALGTGLLFGVLPARRAAALDPVQALARR